MVHKIPPTTSILDEYTVVKVSQGRKIYTNGTRYFTWDSMHGEIEVFNKRGFHLGALDPITCLFIKKAVKGRTINVK